MLKFKPRKSYIFHLAIIGGILAYFFISSFALLVNPYYNDDVSLILMSNLYRSISGLIAITLLFQVLHYLSSRNLVSKRLFFILFLPGCYFISFVWLIFQAIISALFQSNALEFDSLYFVKAFSFMYVVIGFVGLYFLINHWLSLKNQKEMTLQAINLAREAQLQMLRYQINPHFLFNSLNTIRSMVEEDKTQARSMITKLSSFFRYSLSQNGTTDTFENEIS
ncbi:MAG: histidine kinase, partial [Bacteroidales bacterium]|nr:histidine kinase [Bacteroidales bacterium]